MLRISSRFLRSWLKLEAYIADLLGLLFVLLSKRSPGKPLISREIHLDGAADGQLMGTRTALGGAAVKTCRL